MKKFGSMFLVVALFLTMLCSCHSVQQEQEPITTLGVSISDIKNLTFFDDVDFQTAHSDNERTVCRGVFNNYGNNIEIELQFENSTQEVFEISMWGDPGDEDDAQAYVNGLTYLYLDYVTLLKQLLPVLDTSVSDMQQEQICDMLAPLDEEHQVKVSDSLVLNDIQYQIGLFGGYGFDIKPAK